MMRGLVSERKAHCFSCVPVTVGKVSPRSRLDGRDVALQAREAPPLHIRLRCVVSFR